MRLEIKEAISSDVGLPDTITEHHGMDIDRETASPQMQPQPHPEQQLAAAMPTAAPPAQQAPQQLDFKNLPPELDDQFEISEVRAEGNQGRELPPAALCTGYQEKASSRESCQNIEGDTRRQREELPALAVHNGMPASAVHCGTPARSPTPAPTPAVHSGVPAFAVHCGTPAGGTTQHRLPTPAAQQELFSVRMLPEVRVQKPGCSTTPGEHRVQKPGCSTASGRTPGAEAGGDATPLMPARLLSERALAPNVRPQPAPQPRQQRRSDAWARPGPHQVAACSFRLAGLPCAYRFAGTLRAAGFQDFAAGVGIHPQRTEACSTPSGRST